MRTIYAICDYKGRFGTKFTAKPYRSGMDKQLLKHYFSVNGFNVEFIKTYDILSKPFDLNKDLFIYTSSEDKNGFYKSFLNDLILAIESSGAVVIPRYIFLHAHENKVFFEILRNLSNNKQLTTLKSICFGTYEELCEIEENIDFPLVLKNAMGSKSRGVYLVKDRYDLKKISKQISKTKSLFYDLKDLLRKQKHIGYTKESTHRNKFLIQNFIPNLSNDWKILAFGEKFYCLKRRNRKNDFRASGGGLLSYEENIPEGILDFAKQIKDYYNVPHISLDIAFDGLKFYLLEAQFVYFGTYTLEFSSFYFIYRNRQWEIVKQKSILEEEYVNGIVKYIYLNSL